MFSYICGGDKPLWGELKLYGEIPEKYSLKKFSFRKEFLETLCKYIYLGF